MTTLRHQLHDGASNPVVGVKAAVMVYLTSADGLPQGSYEKVPRVSAVSDSQGWLTWTLPPFPGHSTPTYTVTGIEPNPVLIRVPRDVSTTTVALARIGSLSTVDTSSVDLVTEDELTRRLSALPGLPTTDAARELYVPARLADAAQRSAVWNGTPVAGNNSFLDWMHDTSTGSYLLHLHTGPNSDSGSLLALGVGDGGPTQTNGLLVSVKAEASAGAAGIGLVNQPGSAAYGLHGLQNSADAPLILLEQTGDGVAPALTLVANGTPGNGQLLQQWRSGAAGGDIGGVRADTGDFEWQRNLTTQDRIGGTRQYVGVSSDPSIGANSRDHVQLYKESLDFYKWSGSAGQWWSTRIDANANSLRLRAGGATSTVGTPSGLTTLIEMQAGAIGFFGHAPAPQPARPTDLAGVIAALAGLGITA